MALELCISDMKKNPDFLRSQQQLLYHLDGRSCQDRLHVFESLLEVHPCHEWLRCQRAFAYTDNGQHDQACAEWLELLKQSPLRLQFRNGIRCALKALAPEAQIAVISQLHHRDESGRWDALLPDAYYSLGRYDDASRILTDVIQKYSFLPEQEAYFERLQIYCLIGQGNDGAVKERLCRLSSHQLFKEDICRALVDSGYIREAVMLWVDIAKEIPDEALLLTLCEKLQIHPDHSHDVSLWKSLVSASPGPPEPLMGLESSLQKCQDPAVLIRTWRELLADDPDNGVFLGRLVTALRQQEDPGQRVIVWRSLTAKFPHIERFREELYLARGQECRSQGREVDLDSLCCICMDRELNTCFWRCGHISCAGCAEPMDHCYLCRKKIEEKVKVYATMRY